jgi:type I restriction enzyme S subunit
MLVWEGQLDWAFCDHFIRFKTNSLVCLSKYVSYFFASDKVRAQIESSFVSSAGQKTVSQGTLGRILVPVPPREEQAKIVRRIESAFGWLDRMAADHAAAARLIPNLDAAILAKAFQGKLVPQDPDDEPAAKLLEQIKAEREATLKVKRGRKANLPPITGTAEITLGPVTVSATGTVGNAPTRARNVSMTKSRQDDDVKGKPYLAGLLKSGRYSDAQSLFRGAELPVADFYKQLAWEIDKGHILDSADELKAA